MEAEGRDPNGFIDAQSFQEEKRLPRKDILSKFGITDRPDLRVEVIEKPGGPWVIALHSPQDPIKSVTPRQAAELSTLLRDAGEEALGHELATAAANARKANRMA